MLEPKMRFSEFSESYAADTLADVTERVRRKNSENQTDIPLTIASIEGLVDQRTYFGKTIASKDMSGYYLLKNGEFAYNKSYSKGYPVGSIKRLDKYCQGALSTLYICFALKQEADVQSDYLMQYFNSPVWHKTISEICAEGARNHGLLNVSPDDFFATVHHFAPTKEEQDKIAAFLALYDQKVANQMAKVEALETRRKGLLQQIFSQEIRFKADDGSDFEDWEYFELGSFLEEYCDRNSEQKYEPVSVGRLGIRKRSDVFNHELSQDYSKNKLIYPNTLTIGLGSKQIDMVVAPSSLPETYSVSPAYTTYKINNIDSSFLKHIVDANIALLSNRYMIVSVRQGKSVDKTNLMCHQLPIPCIEEQKKIACFIELVDQQIQVEKDKLEAIKNVKKGLLQQMFV